MRDSPGGAVANTETDPGLSSAEDTLPAVTLPRRIPVSLADAPRRETPAPVGPEILRRVLDGLNRL